MEQVLEALIPPEKKEALGSILTDDITSYSDNSLFYKPRVTP